MVFVAIFGKNVEGAFGSPAYLVFSFAGGFAAMMTQTAMTLLFGAAQDAWVPELDASGAVAAVPGAYFVLYPGVTGYAGQPVTWSSPRTPMTRRSQCAADRGGAGASRSCGRYRAPAQRAAPVVASCLGPAAAAPGSGAGGRAPGRRRARRRGCRR
jgi:hypothetical protein